MKINEHPFFSKIQETTTHSLIESAREVACVAGEQIFEEGGASDYLYLVLEGEIGFYKTMPDGKRRMLSASRAGDFFGEIGLLMGRPRALSAKAQTDAVLAIIPGDALRSFISSTPGPVERILFNVIHHLQDTTHHYVDEILHQEKMAVVGNMANSIIHDFNNPFCTIKLAAQILGEQQKDELSQGMCRMIDMQIDAMVGMANDLLDFSRGRRSLHRTPVHAPALLAAFRQLNENLFSASLHCIDVEAEDFIFKADEKKIIRVLQNLVNNALQSIPAGRAGRIRVLISKAGSNTLIRISDNGSGIPEAIRDSLFHPFVTHGKENGHGLGTSIVQSIVQAHDGTITVETETNVGTSFCITLPGSLPDDASPTL